MKKLLSTLCLLSLYAGLLFALSGCDMAYDRSDLAKKRLASRYDEEFEIVEVYPARVGAAWYTVLAKSEDGIVFEASIDTCDENFSDGYTGKLVGAEAARLLKETLPEDREVYIHGEILNPVPPVYGKDITLEEYMEIEPVPWLKLTVFSEDMEGLGDALAAFSQAHSDWVIHGAVYEVDNLSLYEDYFQRRDTLGFDIKMDLETGKNKDRYCYVRDGMVVYE